jgi:hypothetical protein
VGEILYGCRLRGRLFLRFWIVSLLHLLYWTKKSVVEVVYLEYAGGVMNSRVEESKTVAIKQRYV